MPYDFSRLAHGEGSEVTSVQQAVTWRRHTQELAVNSGAANGLTWDSMKITPTSLPCSLITVQSCFVEVNLINEIHILYFNCSYIYCFGIGSGFTIEERTV